MEQLNRIQKFAILIPVIFISGIYISSFIEKFRINQDLRWIYEYGKDFSLTICLGAVTWSIVNSILIFQDLKIEKPKKTLWFLLSVSTFLYLFLIMTIAMTRDVV
jgi:hypothetical protein